jgi:hypothetical protein
MKRRVLVLTLTAGLVGLGIGGTHAQQYPMLDQVANKVVQNYQSMSCEQIEAKRAHPQVSEMEARVVRLLHEDANMRQEFLNRVAGPIANKLFECNLIP